MNSKKKGYQKPKIVTEKVFEQAALACAQNQFSNTKINMKVEQTICGYSSS